MSKISLNQEHGFTLLEVAAAVLLLGLALTTIVGIQTNLVQTYQYERNRTHAALLAQYIMTMIEVAPEAPDDGQEKEKLVDMLESIGFFDEDAPMSDDYEEMIKDWEYARTVVSLDIPPIEGLIQQIVVAIKWGDADDEQFALEYYIKGKAAEQLQQLADRLPGAPAP